MNTEQDRLDILIIGAGVIGTVYGAQLAAAGHSINAYKHGDRTEQIQKHGLNVKDVLTGVCLHQSAKVVSNPSTTAYDLVLIAIRGDQLASVFPVIKQLRGKPTILFFGNNPNGRSKLPEGLSKSVELGFPGIGGAMVGDSVEYVVISQQPTAIQSDASSPVLEFAKALRSRGLKIKSVDDMDGYLMYHAVLIASISAALYCRDCDVMKLSGDRATLTLMCRAIEEGFRALREKGLSGEPRNLRILHLPWLRPFAVRYWSHTFRSRVAELEFAVHARQAKDEMDILAQAVIAATANSPTAHNHIQRLLAP